MEFISRFWKFLDELSEKDPKKYQEFIIHQAQAAGVSKEKLKKINEEKNEKLSGKEEASMLTQLSNITKSTNSSKSKKEKKLLIEELN